ncbi:SCO family protein [Deinococcus fonticola]|uniref:SCO family protein n=1 Tax=Deinococcus fonticola TaxID=2528713 RepID=UPI0010751BA2|nr:SCO family protein [Deinococcus fonticola]
MTPQVQELQPVAAGRPWYVSAILAVCLVTLVLSGAWLFTRAKSPYPFFGTAYDNTPTATAFSGTDDLGKPFTFQPGSGQVTTIFFGFTNCPNICPLTLSYLSKVRAQLTPEQQARWQTLFVSVDPPRDTVKRMHEYVTYFGDGKGVIVPEPQLSAAARAYGVGYQKVDVKGLSDYQINHSTGTYLIDATGHLRAIWDYSQMPQVERLKGDLLYVMEHPVR